MPTHKTHNNLGELVCVLVHQVVPLDEQTLAVLDTADAPCLVRSYRRINGSVRLGVSLVGYRGYDIARRGVYIRTLLQKNLLVTSNEAPESAWTHSPLMYALSVMRVFWIAILLSY